VDGARGLGGGDHPFLRDDLPGRVRSIQRLEGHLEEDQALWRDGAAGYDFSPEGLCPLGVANT